LVIILVTVIIPCFNAAIFLQKTIDSVFSQNNIVCKIIAVDDGSTDNTLDILNQYGDKVLILHHDGYKNKGQAASLNLGLRHAESEYVAFMDADDLWDEKKIVAQVDALQRNPDCVLCYVNGYVVDAKDHRLYPILPEYFQETNILGNILLDCYIRTPSMVMVRRSLFDQIGNFSEAYKAPDHDMWVRASEAGKFCYVDQHLVGYRQHAGQASVNYARKMWDDEFDVLREAANRYPYSERIKRKRASVLYFRIGQCDLKDRKFLYAIYDFMRSFLYDPRRAVTFFYFSVRERVGTY
jgi:glycosyltransferase involved in cell wall biosynthesis